MKIVSEFIDNNKYYLNINEKILLEITQILNSINIILSGALKANSKKKDLDNRNKKAKLPEDKCLLTIECAKVEIVKNTINDFDPKLAKEKGCTEAKISEIQKKAPEILKLIGELQTSFVGAISGEKKQEKITKIDTTTQTTVKAEEKDIEIITMEDWKNPKIQKDETSNFEATSSEIISQEDWKQETNTNQESIKEELIIENPDKYFKEFNSGNIDTIKDFYKLCVENNKNSYFNDFLNNYFQNLETLTKLEIINFLINSGLDKKIIKDNLYKGLSSKINSKNDKQVKLYIKVSSKLNPPKTNPETKFEEIEANPEISSKQTTSNGLVILSSQGVFNEEEKVELENTSPEDLEEIKEVTLVEENEEEDIKEEETIVVIDSNAEETVIKPIIKEETHIRIVKKREEKAETIPEIPGINKDEVITFIGLLGTNKKENNDFFSKNKFDIKPFEKSEIFKIVRNKINILCDELDYTRLYYLLELAEKIDLFLNLKGLRKKFLNLALKLSKTEKNNTIFKLFLDKYIINN